MSLSVDVFWSFRSPYSYLVTSKLRALQEAFDVTINMRPVYPLAVRSEGFFTKADPLFIPYLMRDIRRLPSSMACRCNGRGPIRW